MLNHWAFGTGALSTRRLHSQLRQFYDATETMEDALQMAQQIKDDTKHDRTLAWGLNLSEPDVTTQEEIDEFRRISNAQLGIQQPGLDFWLDTRPDVLKRYRAWADLLTVRDADEAPNKWKPNGIAILYLYAMANFEDGIRYSLYGMNHQGLTREQILEVWALVFRYAGPLGMASIAKIARSYTPPAATRAVKWPEGWVPDPEAFRSGADFRSAAASPEDTQKILAWYERWLGEVPKHIRLLARHRPDLLKIFRSRYENTLRVLPKQIEPYALLQISMLHCNGHGIREGMLLARGFGVTKPQILEALSWGTFYGGVPALGLVEDVAGDVLNSWPQ